MKKKNIKNLNGFLNEFKGKYYFDQNGTLDYVSGVCPWCKDDAKFAWKSLPSLSYVIWFCSNCQNSIEWEFEDRLNNIRPQVISDIVIIKKASK